ncbi:MAG: acylphosphatase [Anaerolineales bacterium]|nr:acylphosphatase [Anaerolineales bacterium]
MNVHQSEKARIHIWVKGRVQGVGFRAHVEYYASLIGVTGWVRNVGLDAVETLAEGTRDELEKFIELVKQGPSASRVDEARVEWEVATNEFMEFGVKRSL